VFTYHRTVLFNDPLRQAFFSLKGKNNSVTLSLRLYIYALKEVSVKIRAKYTVYN